MKVVIIGGGPGGFSAAMVAKRVGADVTLIERTDALGGLGLVAGIGLPFASPSIFAEEKALGGADLVDIFYSIAVYNGMVPGVGDNVLLYNVTKLDSRMQKAIKEAGIELMLRKRVADVEMSDSRVKAVILQDGTSISGDVFVDGTGATEGPEACDKWGRGCVDCILRCPAFGPPGGIVEKRVKTVARINAYGEPGVMGTSVLISIASLSTEVQREVNEKGYAIIPVPPGATMDEDRMKRAGTVEMFKYDIHKLNIILLNVGGFVKVTAVGSPMWVSSLRSFPGLEDALIAQPTAGAKGHLVCRTTIALRDNSLKVDGFENLFCVGNKAGPTHSLMDAIVTGDLAGYNAVRWCLGQSCLELPKTLMVGAFIDLAGQKARTEGGLNRGYSVGESEILKDLGVYREDKEEIIKEVDKAGLRGIYQTKVC